MSISGNGTGNLAGATPHLKKKHTGRWSNVSMDVNSEKSRAEEIKKAAKVRDDIEVPRNPSLDAIIRSSCYDYIMIAVCIAYAI
jgi:hypothetical protein